MWLIYVILASLFSALTTIFANIGVKKIDSMLATILRTIVVLIFSFLIIYFSGTLKELFKVDIKTFIYLILSSISLALLWLSYFKALQLGEVNSVSAVDKTSIILTLLLASIFLNERITFIKIISSLLIILGNIIMLKRHDKEKDNKWLLYAILTAVFTSLVTIFGKYGIKDIDSNVANFIRTFIVVVIIGTISFIKGKQKKIRSIDKKSWFYILLSGLSTGLSWLFYFYSLKDGEASIIFPLEKLNIVFVVIGSSIFLKERINKKQLLGISLIVLGIVLLIL